MRGINGAIILILVTVCFGAWYYAISTYLQHKEEILLYLDEVTRTLALPYRIAQLSLEEPVNELPVPVYGVRVSEIADTWNAPRADGRTHEGVDIFAARGTPVFSVTRGYVVRAGTNTLGGISVFVIGPGNVRYYYAHLERIADGITVGMPVTPDTVLGYVGNSGNAESTAPHLHFGIYQGGAQNPYPLLRERVP